MSLKNQKNYRFPGFRLNSRERRLECNGVPVPIGPKVLDALVLLLENAGTLVERSTMRDRLWPDQIVEDGTLARVIADLRKVLGDAGEARRYIETVPKFGYRFVAVVEEESVINGSLADGLVPGSPELTKPLEKQPGRWRPKHRWVFRIAAGVVLLAGAGFVLHRMRPQPAAIQSLLITPFQTIGEAPDAAMLQLGLQDSLTMELSGLSGLAVIEFKPESASPVDSVTDAAELGRRHRAGFVLAGTIQLAPGQIHINARLLRSATGEALWARSFEESQDDVLKVESRLAKLTVAELIPTLSVGEDERMARRLPANSLAYRYYLLGRHYWNKRDENAYDQAIENFTKAAEADPAYAPAYVGLADSYLLETGFRTHPAVETFPKAKAAIDKAIQMDPSLGDAHATLAMIAESYSFAWDNAEMELRTAIRLAPNYVTAHHWFAEFLTMMGKFDLSEAEFEAARNLDPASPIILTDLAQLYLFEKKYPRSLQTLDEVLSLEPSFHLAHDRKGYALMMMRRPDEAVKEFEAGDRQAGRVSAIWERAWAAAVEGKKRQAAELARQAEQDRPNAFMLSVIWAELGDTDHAMDWLEKAYEARSPGLISLRANPLFDRLRSCERFRALLRQMNLS